MTCVAERKRLVGILGDFARERTTVRQLEEGLAGLSDAADEDVWVLARYYSDKFGDDDSRILVDRDEWNELQRTLLFLESDLPLVEPETRLSWPVVGWGCDAAQVWASSAAVAGVSLFWFSRRVALLFLVCATMLCFWHRIRVQRGRRTVLRRLPVGVFTPFASPLELIRQRRAVPGFVKTPYPESLRRRYEECLRRGNIVVLAGLAVLAFAALFAAFTVIWPVVLFVLCLPVWREPETAPIRYW